MPPFGPPTSRPPPTPRGNRDPRNGNTRDGHQAGRAPLRTAAQQSARSLQEVSSPTHRPPNKSTSTPSFSKKNRPQAWYGGLSLPGIEGAEGQPYQQAANGGRKPFLPHAPIIPSPLNPTSLNFDSFDAMPTANDDAGNYSGPATAKSIRRKAVVTGDTPENILPSSTSMPKPHPTLARATLLPPDLSQQDNSSVYFQLNSPKSVRDLGPGYSRYFNPFTTPTTSHQDLKNGAQTQQPEGPYTAENQDRLSRCSNPFLDAKRSSHFSGSTSVEPEALDGLITPPLPTTSDDHCLKPNVRGTDPEKACLLPWIDDRLAATNDGFPLMSDEKEADDDMHMPKWDDDTKLKPKLRDRFTRESLVSSFGILLMLGGLCTICIVLPVLSYTGMAGMGDTPLDQMFEPQLPGEDWARVNVRNYSLLSNIRTGLIDPDTPEEAKTKKSIDGSDMKLVFSDEFNKPNRSFYDEDDPYWYGFNGWYGATQDLEWYDPDALNTGDGTLQIQADSFRNHNLDFRSGMLHSWNKLCLKGGLFEVSMSLPGPAGVHGLWPGVWTIGNLGRPGYLATTDGMWPYTYDSCDSGITPNQSMTDGTSSLPGQRLPSCTCPGADHPSPGTGRGAPEIDIAEGSGDWGGMGLGVVTQSFQVAPFDVFYYPNYDFMQTPHYELSFVNTYTGGPFQQAVSTTSMLNNTWYDGLEYQKYAFEYQPGCDPEAYIAWTIADVEMMRFDARALGPNGNIGQRLVSEEPMSMVLNLGMSHNWADVQMAALSFPTILRIDYVRWYQREGEEMVTCDPPGYETTEWIERHRRAYDNANFTTWEQAGFEWPRNEIVHGCEG